MVRAKKSPHTAHCKVVGIVTPTHKRLSIPVEVLLNAVKKSSPVKMTNMLVIKVAIIRPLTT